MVGFTEIATRDGALWNPDHAMSIRVRLNNKDDGVNRYVRLHSNDLSDWWSHSKVLNDLDSETCCRVHDGYDSLTIDAMLIGTDGENQAVIDKYDPAVGVAK
jgi:hypothetical protein